MADDKTIVYIKQPDEQPIPVTARIMWLPDGTIKPCMFWLPDNSCHEIVHVYECTLMAYLKDRGVGIRFKVRTALNPLTTYLYFTDEMFCGKNFIDSRYDHGCKEYVAVVLDVFSDGDYELCYFWVQGVRYVVEKTLAVEPHGSYLAGGVGVRHRVSARVVNAGDDEDLDPRYSVRREAALFFEVNKWFTVISNTTENHQ